MKAMRVCFIDTYEISGGCVVAVGGVSPINLKIINPDLSRTLETTCHTAMAQSPDVTIKDAA